MEKSDIFIYLLSSFMIGVLFASFFINSFYFILIALIVAFILIGVFWKNNLDVLGFCLVVFSLGMFCYSFSLFKIENNYLTKFDNQEVSLEGRVCEEVKRGLLKKEIVVCFEKGRALVFDSNNSRVGFGDKILVKGVLKIPEKYEDFDYRGYLAKDGISVLFNFPQIEIIEKGNNPFIFYLKDRAREEIKKDMPFKEGVVIEGMILGDDSRMDKDLKARLNASGLSHAIAISGSHMVLFSFMLFELLMIFGFWRKQAQIAVIIFTIFYIVLVGMPASAVRSGIMICLLLLSQLIGRQSSAWRTIIIAGFLIVFENPLALKFDLGFQLSFLAVIGMMFVGPSINYYLNQLFKDRLKYLREIIVMTLSAQFFVIPVLINSFNSVSLVSVFSNVFAAPLLPLIMALGILFPFIGIIIPLLGWFISLFCTIFVSVLLFIVYVSSSVPFAFLKADIPFCLFLIVYIPLCYLIFKKTKKKDLEFLA